MSKKNGKANRHKNRLVRSTQDDVGLAEAVESRFLTLCESYLRIKGVQIPIPQSLSTDLLKWRRMRVRHRQGDFRHTEVELEATKTIAQWTLDENAVLRNQEKQILEWKEG